MYLPVLYFVTPVLTFIYVCLGKLYSYSLAANNEATNVNYRFMYYVLSIEYISSHSFRYNYLPKHRTLQYTIIQSTSTRTTDTNIDEQLTSPSRQRFDVTRPKVSVPRAFRSPLIYIFAVSRY